VKPKLKRRLIIFLALLLGGFIALNAVAYRQAWAMMHFTSDGVRTEKPENLSFGKKIEVLFCGVDLPRPHSSLTPDKLGLACRAIVIPETNGIRLGAWYCPAAPSGPLVILFHGYAGDKSGMLPEAAAILEMNCSVMLVDFRGSGDSSESYTTVGYYEADDVAAAVNYARTELPQSKLVLYGGSMGAAAVLRAVALCGVQPDAIIVEGVFDKMLNTVRHRFEAMGVPSSPGAQLLVFWGGVQAGFDGFDHNPVQYAAAVRCPILFLHGAADPRARLEDARRVFDAVSAPKRFQEFPALGHEAAVARFPAEWKNSVAQFLQTSVNKTLP
jgi:dipeptidyl aminopeptidase/acylaminoacyl peptidase